MLYSKNGSIPKPQTDGTEGWIEVPEPPVAGDGQEVVWWYPPGWVVRPVCPNEAGMAYNWSQSNQEWVATPVPVEEIALTTLSDLVDTADTVAFTSATTASSMVSSNDAVVLTLDPGLIDFGSSAPETTI